MVAPPMESVSAPESENQPSGKGRAGISRLTAEERIQRARLAAHSLHAKTDSRKHTEPGRAALQSKYERLVDPDGVLDEAERKRRAKHAERAHMARMALASSVARRKIKEAREHAL